MVTRWRTSYSIYISHICSFSIFYVTTYFFWLKDCWFYQKLSKYIALWMTVISILYFYMGNVISFTRITLAIMLKIKNDIKLWRKYFILHTWLYTLCLRVQLSYTVVYERIEKDECVLKSVCITLKIEYIFI